jgi:hypothetical protein
MLTKDGVYDDQMTPEGLTIFERALLDFEETFPDLDQAEKAPKVRRMLGIGIVRYYQHLYRLLDVPQAEAYSPKTVHRLRAAVAAKNSRMGRIGA